MPLQDYNRYAPLTTNDVIAISTMPFVEIPTNPSDKFEYWNSNFSRLDKLSQKYYSNPFYDFLILYANNIYVSEFDIPDGTLIRIPFPLGKAKADYEALLTAYKKQ
jgi:hypothetical protein